MTGCEEDEPEEALLLTCDFLPEVSSSALKHSSTSPAPQLES